MFRAIFQFDISPSESNCRKLMSLIGQMPLFRNVLVVNFVLQRRKEINGKVKLKDGVCKTYKSFLNVTYTLTANNKYIKNMPIPVRY